MDFKENSKIFKALGDETRAEIFDMLKNGSLCACKIQEKFELTQPTLSHHLKVLCDCNLIVGKRDGKWIYYSINCETLNSLIDFLSDAKCKRNKG